MSASDRVPGGRSLQESCGLRLPDRVTCDWGSGAQKANSAGMRWLSEKLLLVSFMLPPPFGKNYTSVALFVLHLRLRLGARRRIARHLRREPRKLRNAFLPGQQRD